MNYFTQLKHYLKHLFPQKIYHQRNVDSHQKAILIAGHDLKFIEEIIEKLRDDNYRILIDNWKGHDQHSVRKSQKLLKQADIIICEWCLGNAVWYSKHKKENQKLIIRFHRQEIETKYPENITIEAIDKIVFVSNTYLQKAKNEFSWNDDSKLTVVGNYTIPQNTNLLKIKDAKFNLGIVGIVPKMKRFDRALDILEELRHKDKRFQLFIKGKTEKDYPWMKDRPEEFKYYQEQQERINNSKYLHGAVHFDGFGKDMPQWYQKIGFVLSTSDFESFHLTIADGASSGAIPIILKWEGSDEIYPEEWSMKNVDEAVKKILTLSKDNSKFAIEAGQCQEYVQKFNLDNIYNEWEKIL